MGGVTRFVKNIVNDPWPTIGTVVGATLGGPFGAAAGNALGNVASQGFDGFRDDLGQNLLSAGLSAAGTYAAGQAGDLMNSTSLSPAVNAVDAASNAAREAVSSAATSAIPSGQALSNFLPGASSIGGGGTSGGFFSDLLGGAQDLYTGASDAFGGLTDFIGDAGQSIGNATGLTDIAAGASDAFGGVSDFLGDAGTAISDGLGFGGTSGLPQVPASTMGQAFTVDPNLPWLSDVAMGSAAPNAASLPWLSDVASGAISANPVTNPPTGLAGLFSDPVQTITDGAEEMFSLNNLARQGLKSGIGYGLMRDNNAGYDGMIEAARMAGQNSQPFLQSGQQATGTLSALYGLDTPEAQSAAIANFENTPGYNFARDQGVRALDASAASRGMLRSGNQEQAVQNFGTGLAQQYYQQYLDNLARQQATGVTAADDVAAAEMLAARNAANRRQAQIDPYNQMIGGVLSGFFS